MPLIPFELHPQYHDWWYVYQRNRTPEGMEHYLRIALGTQYRTYPTDVERQTEVTKKFPEPVLPPEVIPDEPTAETLLKLRVLNMEGKPFFTEKPVMEFRIKRPVQEVPTHVTIDPVGTIRLGTLADLGFWRAFKRELQEQLSDPHTQLFLQFMVGDWIRTGGLKADVGNPLSALTTWFSKIMPNWADDIDKFTTALKGMWARVTPDWINSVDGIKTRVSDVWDWLTPDWMNSINNIKKEMDKFNAWWQSGLTDMMKAFKKDYNDNVVPLVTSLNKGLKRWNTAGEAFIDLQMKAAKIVTEPGNWLDENFTVPLRTMKGNIDEQLSRTANYLALFGIKEGQKAMAYTNTVIKLLTLPAEKITIKIDRWERQVMVTLQEFAQNEFREAQKKVNRATNIIDATIELLNIEDPETARLRKEPFERTLGAYPATSIIGNEERTTDRMEFKYIPIPTEDFKNPDAEYWFNILGEFDKNLYVDDKGTPIASARGRDGKFTFDRSMIMGNVVAISDALAFQDHDVLKDLEARIKLYEYGLSTATYVNQVLSIDPWVKIGDFSLPLLNKTVFWIGTVVDRMFMHPDQTHEVTYQTVEGMEADAREIDNWINNQIRAIGKALLDGAPQTGNFFVYRLPI